MSEVKHTPGPWTLETVPTSVGVCHKVGRLGSSTKITNACLYDDCYSVTPRDMQLLADAHLIAAAPELLEALGEVPCVECGHPLRLHIDQYGCEFDRGDGYRMGSEYEVALGPCACHGGESGKKAIAALAKAGRP